MTKYGVKYHPDVKLKDLPEINSDMKSRIKKAIEERLQVAPYDYGLPLRKSLKRYWKLRVGDYRVVYQLHDTTADCSPDNNKAFSCNKSHSMETL